MLLPQCEALHQRALTLSRSLRRLEWQLIEVLQKIEQIKLYKKMGYPSLFQYAVEALNLSESVAYAFIAVARKGCEVRQLNEALQAQRLSVSKASRMVSVVTGDTASEMIEFARCHTSRELDLEVARRNPKAATRDRVNPTAGGRVELRINIAQGIFEKLKRAQSLEAQRGSNSPSLEMALDAVLEEYLNRRDPVRRAQRAKERQKAADMNEITPERENVTSEHGNVCLVRVSPTPRSRTRLRARDKHDVVHRDGGRCTFQDPSGRRCNNDRWLETHHLQPVSQGGGNDPRNLTTVCSFHHDLIHQLSLAIEGQVTWIRSPRCEYVAGGSGQTS